MYPFHFIFPTEARKEDMWICGREIFLFCDEDLPKIVLWWIICLVSCLFTFFGISMHLHDLSMFRTNILEENNFRQKQEINYIRNHVGSVLYSRPQSTDLGLMLLNQTKWWIYHFFLLLLLLYIYFSYKCNKPILQIEGIYSVWNLEMVSFSYF